MAIKVSTVVIAAAAFGAFGCVGPEDGPGDHDGKGDGRAHAHYITWSPATLDFGTAYVSDSVEGGGTESTRELKITNAAPDGWVFWFTGEIIGGEDDFSMPNQCGEPAPEWPCWVRIGPHETTFSITFRPRHAGTFNGPLCVYDGEENCLREIPIIAVGENKID